MMVVVPSKTASSASSSPLSTAPQTEEKSTKGSLSFSELLRGVITPKATQELGEKKEIKAQKEETIKLPIELSSKITKTLSEKKDIKLEKDVKVEKQELEKFPLEFNPKVTQNMTPKELKVLINEAKQYLKDKITASEGFKKSEIDALPKTLKGLAQVAEKFGIDLSKITLQEIKSSVKVATSEMMPIAKEATKEVAKEEKTDTNKKEIPLRTDATTQTKESKKVAVQNVPLQENEKSLHVGSSQTDTKVKENAKEQTPLFKAQVSNEISTEQIVQAKTNNIEFKTPKEKADDALRQLLRGEKTAKTETGVSSDISVAASKAILPTTPAETSKGLESLLRGDIQVTDNSTSQSKLDGLNVSKADSLDVKINEAKQMIRYLSQDVKTAIEDYKSPFTRIKVQLNPQRLGEIDLTVVQRGNNLHISLSSNNAAINTLAMNAADLRTQLANSGINNATLNFSNNPQGDNGSAAQQQNNQQQKRQAEQEYNYFKNDEANEEILSSLEIVVAHYA